MKTVSDKVVKHLLTQLSVQNDWWGQSLLPKILGQTDRDGEKSPIFDLFSSAEPQP